MHARERLWQHEACSSSAERWLDAAAETFGAVHDGVVACLDGATAPLFEAQADPTDARGAERLLAQSENAGTPNPVTKMTKIGSRPASPPRAVDFDA